VSAGGRLRQLLRSTPVDLCKMVNGALSPTVAGVLGAGGSVVRDGSVLSTGAAQPDAASVDRDGAKASPR
jgi:hypothetical protein